MEEKVRVRDEEREGKRESERFGWKKSGSKSEEDSGMQVH